uniref:Dolichol-phosphate mannosyltransferase subunit 3 n=1 Tax=Kalanchoe fedtschenkoi TaxID=63787 RepID=A0A7N0U3B9_KALFE
MKHIVKIISLLVAISALWIGLLQSSVISPEYALMLPVYLVVSLGCYGLLMVGVGLMQFPTCPQESVLLQQVFTLYIACSMQCCMLFCVSEVWILSTSVVQHFNLHYLIKGSSDTFCEL